MQDDSEIYDHIFMKFFAGIWHNLTRKCLNLNDDLYFLLDSRSGIRA